MRSILIGVGANLPIANNKPRKTCGAALFQLEKKGVQIVKRSSWYYSAPVPKSRQPWYINAVVALKTTLAPEILLDNLLLIEKQFGRCREKKNAARILDLDILSYDNLTKTMYSPARNTLILPHPELMNRAFVLIPIRDIAPNWQHPINKLSVNELIEQLPPGQSINKAKDAPGFFGTEFFGNAI